MARDPLRLGIIGAGLIAQTHEAGFAEIPDLCRVVAVCDINLEQAQDQAAQFEAKVSTSYHELVEDPEIDLLDITLPHHLHYDVAMAALSAGKDVLLEKPIAMTYRQSQEILEKARQKGVHFSVAENTRYIKAYQAAASLLEESRLGKIMQVRTFLPANERIRLSSPEFWGRRANNGGGCLIDSGPHTFYLLKWLFGGVRDLRAFSTILYEVGSEVEDNADVRGHLSNGAEFLSSFTFTAEIPHSERLEIYGSKGALIIDQLANPVAKYYPDPTEYDGIPIDGVPYDPMGWHFFSIVEEVKDVIAAVYEDRPPLVDPQDCLYAVKVIEKAYESISNGNGLMIV